MPLSAQQEQVLALISAGSSITAAAQTAGLHRNTIYNWLRSAPAFRLELDAARDAKAAYWRDQAEQHTATAIETIRALMTDPAAPASVRLKAALSILNLATIPPLTLPVASQSPYSMHNSAQSTAEVPSTHQPPAATARQTPAAVHNSAQSTAEVPSTHQPPAATARQAPAPVHKSAQPDSRPGPHPAPPVAQGVGITF